MPSRYSEETRRELDRLYLLGAEKVVAHRGWEAGSVREITKVLEMSRGPIHDHFKGLRLEKALIAETYLHLSRAILRASQKPGTFDDLLQVVVDHLRQDKEAARLMVQVAALAAADEAPDADELRADIIVARVGAAKFIEQQLGERLGTTHQRARDIKSEAIVKWYELACMSLVMHVAPSDPDLLSLATGFRSLS